MPDLVQDFYEKYYKFAKSIRTGSKSQFTSLNTISTINAVLESLISLIKHNKLSEIDNYTIYNTLLISKIYISKITEPTAFTPKKVPIMNLKNNLKKLEELNITRENFKSRQ